ncbi:MAG: hypothetical protein JSW34_12950 [Candidatus Zixiibacteriota bacterium]|nr:MAG: hypothetical protein JSW34_12950 [candidate division Zixibacteria bacterium]
MYLDEQRQARFKTVRLIAYAMLGAAPLIYIVIAYLLSIPARHGGEQQMMLYILLIVAIVQPSVVKFIERFQVTGYQKNTQSQMTPDNLFFTLSIIKFAFVETIYIFGLVVYLVSGNLDWMLYFYPVGIGWTLVYWPRQSNYERFLQRLESGIA